MRTIWRMVNKSDRRREMEQLFVLREAEGLTYRELSEHSGIPLGTLNWWAHRLRHEDPDECGFVAAGEFELASSTDSADTSMDARLKHPSGLVIELRGEYADQVVSAVLQDLLSWS